MRQTKYWFKVIAHYIKTKRHEQNKTQKQLPVRGTASRLENEKDFRFSTLVRNLETVNGNMSELFRSHVPRSLHGKDQELHEMLQRLLATGNPHAEAIRQMITFAFDELISKKPNNKS